MNYIVALLLLLSLTVVYSYDHNWFSNLYMGKQEADVDDTHRKFGSPRENIFRLMPLHYQQHQPVQTPSCLPYGWTCGQGLAPCCSGLICYGGNAKRGQYCVTRR